MDSFAYTLKDIKPNEAQFIMDAILNLAAPLNVSGPIYTKIQAQIESQNSAFMETQKKVDTKASKPAQAVEPVKPAKPVKAGPKNKV